VVPFLLFFDFRLKIDAVIEAKRRKIIAFLATILDRFHVTGRFNTHIIDGVVVQPSIDERCQGGTDWLGQKAHSMGAAAN